MNKKYDPEKYKVNRKNLNDGVIKNIKEKNDYYLKYQNKYEDIFKKGYDKLIKNYGIGAQIIKSLNIKNMILVTRSKKKVVGLEGYGIKIIDQEILK